MKEQTPFAIFHRTHMRCGNCANTIDEDLLGVLCHHPELPNMGWVRKEQTCEMFKFKDESLKSEMEIALELSK